MWEHNFKFLTIQQTETVYTIQSFRQLSINIVQLRALPNILLQQEGAFL